MHRLLVLPALALALAFAGTAQAAPLTYRTDTQAERYLEHNLKRWGGMNLASQDFKMAFCVNGFYSDHEDRTGHHFADKQSKYGESLFHTFSCTLTSGSRSFNLYLVAQPHGYAVSADR